MSLGEDDELARDDRLGSILYFFQETRETLVWRVGSVDRIFITLTYYLFYPNVLLVCVHTTYFTTNFTIKADAIRELHLYYKTRFFVLTIVESRINTILGFSVLLASFSLIADHQIDGKLLASI